MPRVLNCHRDEIPEEAIWVDRSTGWGNPLVRRPGETPEQLIARYEKWLNTQPQLLAQLPSLRGYDLVCHDAPKPCHADVLLRLANP